ncbi:MAG TPA: winged helix-turn-helix domain-containing protein [Steroidobacteraceae bacterium]|nr:winged helix-turn-helix domain-containing protein [Steroidobacteraceae bacterium]
MNAEPPASYVQPLNGYQVIDLLIDTRLRQVIRNGVDLGITGLSFDLLLTLARAAPNLVSTDALMAGVWKGVVVSPETVTQRVKMLRKALGDKADAPRYIAVLRGHGYRMLASALPIDAPAREAQPDIQPAENVPLDPPASRRTPLRRDWHLALVAAVLVTAAGGIWWALRPMKGGPVQELHRNNPAVAAPGSIAVMPFANLTGDAGKEYLAGGMAEGLINSLSGVTGLKVAARISSFAYGSHDTDVRRIARDLGVATVLEGGVHSAGERLRISARLLDAQGSQIWSQTYDRAFSDLFKLQDDLARQIIQALSGRFNITLPALGARPQPTPDLQAYQLYLQAREVSRGNPTTLQASYDLINQSLVRDPNFADALAFRAFTWSNLYLYDLVPLSALGGAQRDAQHALELQPGLADAHVALGAADEILGNWTDAETHFRAAIAANPADPWSRVSYAILVLLPTGRLQEATAQLRTSYALAPASGYAIHELGLADTLTGEDAEAMKLVKLNQELGGGGPPDWETVLLYTRAARQSGQYQTVSERAVNTLPIILRNSGGAAAIRAFYGALADPTKRLSAVQALQAFEPALLAARIDGQTKVYFVNLLVMLDALNPAYTLAQQFLDQTRESPGSGHWTSLWFPEMRPFRQDPRFRALVERLKMIEYWQEYGPPDECDLKGGELTCH